MDKSAMGVHIIFAHPQHDSFTGNILDSFVAGLESAGHRCTISDLYAMGFDPILDAHQYARESSHDMSMAVPDDVLAEQAKLNAADIWVFIYPLWWTDCPAILKGWFDRVWSVGYAYTPDHTLPGTQRPAQKALALCTAGHTELQLRESGCYQAIETTMIKDRLTTRSLEQKLVIFGGSADLTPQEWSDKRQQHLDKAYELGSKPLR